MGGGRDGRETHLRGREPSPARAAFKFGARQRRARRSGSDVTGSRRGRSRRRQEQRHVERVDGAHPRYELLPFSALPPSRPAGQREREKETKPPPATECLKNSSRNVLALSRELGLKEIGGT